MSFKLQPCDVCVDVNESMTPWAILERWALGNPHTHVRVFFYGATTVFYAPGLFYESVGRGVILSNCEHAVGKKMVVMRPYDCYVPHLGEVVSNMWEIATNPQSFYDYACIPGLVVPRLVCEKLGIPLPLKYQRNPIMICSEAAAEPFWRANLPVLPQDVVPLPHDFLSSPVFYEAHTGAFDLTWL